MDSLKKDKIIKKATYRYDSFEQLERQRWAEIALERRNDKVELFSLDVGELDAVDLLGAQININKTLTKNGW